MDNADLFDEKSDSIEKLFKRIDNQLLKKYSDYGCQGHSLLTKIFLCMCQQGNKKVTSSNCHEYISCETATFKKLHCGSYKSHNISVSIGIVIGLADSYEQALEFLYAAHITIGEAGNDKYDFYNYILKKYCNNTGMKSIDKLHLADEELVAKGYKSLFSASSK